MTGPSWPWRYVARRAGLALAMVATLTSCVGPVRSSTAAEPMVLAFDQDLTGGVRQALIDRWNQEHPDHPARIVDLPSGADLARSQIVGALQSGSGGFDIVNMDVTWTAEFAAGGLLRSWPASLDDDFLDPVKDTVRYHGKSWGVPFNTDAGLLYYRKDILAQQHITVPVTPGELDRQADRVEDRTDLAGYISQLGEYEGLTVNVMEAIWARDGDLPARNEGDVQRISEGITDLVDRARFRMHQDSPNADESSSMRTFADGEVAFMRNWPFAYSRLANSMEDFSDRVGVARLPWSSALGGQNLAVTSTADDPGWARKLIEFLTSRASERCLLEWGFAATRESAYRARPGEVEVGGGQVTYGGRPRCDLPRPAQGNADEDVAGKGRAEAPVTGEGVLRPDLYGLLLKSLKQARTRPVTPYYAAFTREVQQAVHGALDGRDNAAIDRLQKRLDRILKGK